MIKMENCEVVGWEHAVRGMRNPMNSWNRCDSCFQGYVWCNEFCGEPIEGCDKESGLYIGPNDYDLMTKLADSGSVHAKYRRMIVVYVDITAPLYWWKEFDTYKIGTTANSCSTMHKIHSKEFALDDFSYEHLLDPQCDLLPTINTLNMYREMFVDTKDKKYWYQLIQLLPSSYNQKRTVMLNYEVLANIYPTRRNHKLDEWHAFCDWIERLPYSELITLKDRKEDK